MRSLFAEWFKRHKKVGVAVLVAMATIVILPFLKDVISYEYEKYREDLPTEKINKSAIEEYKDNKVIVGGYVATEENDLVESINQLGDVWEKNYSELTEKYIDNLEQQKKMFETFSYLEGADPKNNYGVFLESYYGINDRTRMGKVVVDSLIDKEIRWALKINKVYIEDNPKSIIVLLSPVRSVCEGERCPEGFNDKLLVSLCDCDATTKFLQDTREGDYVFLEGKGRLLESEKVDMDYRQRFSPIITAYNYRPNK